MIGAVAFCPHPPALVPELAQGAAPDLASVRTACRRAIGTVAVPQRSVVLLGPGPESVRFPPSTRGSLARYGVPVEAALGRAGTGPPELPLSLTVGAWLIHEALGDTDSVGFAVGADWADSDAAGEWAAVCGARTELALVVLGDGSGWRDAVAPGRLGERAAAFDADVAAALGSGDPARLALDPAEAAELMVGGAPAWRVVADTMTGRYRADLDLVAAPFGVGYFVATWT